jgi:hypothetical protein
LAFMGKSVFGRFSVLFRSTGLAISRGSEAFLSCEIELRAGQLKHLAP